jgi:hypothetical protein
LTIPVKNWSFRSAPSLLVGHGVDPDALEISGRFIRTARLAEEWYRDLNDPGSFVENLKRAGANADIFTFWERLPITESRYPYQFECETIAVLSVSTYEHWWKEQINNKTRNLVVKARKKGVVVRKAVFDDRFVEGMTAIFNETPIRQERPFLHFGKTVAMVKRQFSRYLFREELLGAYIDDELIGFAILADAGRFAALTQIISCVKHRDKSPNNALMAKAVEVCAERNVSQLVYALWPRGPLREFKRHNGFEPINWRRYYVPLTLKGALALKLNLHRSLVDHLPESTILFFKDIRTKFYTLRYKDRTLKEASGGAVSPHRRSN